MDQNTETGNETTTAEQQSPGRAKRILKKTGKVIAVTSAMDVLAKDLKRVRPRYPDLWRQVFSKEGLIQAKKRFLGSDSQKKAKDRGSARNDARRSLVNAVVTAGITFFVGAYAIRVMTAQASDASMMLIPMLAGACFLFISAINAIIAIKIAALLQRANTNHDRTSKSNNRKGPGGMEHE